MSTTYTQEIRDRWKYCATWLPSREVRVGDVAVLIDHEYRRVGEASECDIEIEIRESPGRALLEHWSADAVDVRVGGAAYGPDVLPEVANAGASLEIGFSRQNAVFFQAGPTTILEIANLKQIGARIMALYEEGEWPADHVLVTEVVKAERTTVLIASGKDASVRFGAEAGVEIGPTSLIDASIGLKRMSSKNVGTLIESEVGLTPLFRASGVKRHVIKKSRFGPIRTPQQQSFGELDYADFE